MIDQSAVVPEATYPRVLHRLEVVLSQEKASGPVTCKLDGPINDVDQFLQVLIQALATLLQHRARKASETVEIAGPEIAKQLLAAGKPRKA
jgi:mannose/fructose/N-acetylgalactosamine-specific phosphotransferase system component IIC